MQDAPPTTVYSLSIALETLAAPLAAENGDTGHWEGMASALRNLAGALEVDDRSTAAEPDMRFHQAMVRTARNGRLARAWEAFADQTLLFVQVLSHVRPDVQAAAGGHGTVLEALVAGDGLTATRARRDHLLAAKQAIAPRSRRYGRLGAAFWRARRGGRASASRAICALLRAAVAAYER